MTTRTITFPKCAYCLLPAISGSCLHCGKPLCFEHTHFEVTLVEQTPTNWRYRTEVVCAACDPTQKQRQNTPPNAL